MNYEDKRRYLESYALLDLQVEELLNEKRKWLNRALDLSTLVSEEISSAVYTNNALRKVDTLERKIDEQIDKVIDLRNSIMEKINMLDDQLLKQILFQKYINSKTLEEVGEELGYCVRHIARKHKQAIEQIEF